MNLRVFALIALATLASVAVAQQELNIADNLGTRFVVGFGTNAGSSSYPEDWIFTLSSKFATSVTIHFGSAHVGATDETFQLQPNVAMQKRYPHSMLLAHDTLDGGAPQNKGIEITSDKEISISGTSIYTYTTDGFMGLPVDVLGTDYFVATQNKGAIDGGWVLIIGQAATTVVTITPKVLMSGKPAGVPFQVTLNKQDSYWLQGGNDIDITGTMVSATAPVAVFAGYNCANIGNIGACDHVNNQVPPLDTLGKKFALRHFGGRSAVGDVIRIAATKDNTVLSINSLGVVTSATLQTGQVHELSSMMGPTTIESTEAVIVLQLMKGSSGDIADPAMTFATPVEQFSNSYIFAPVGPLAGANKHFVTVVAPTAKTAGVRYDDAPVVGTWELVPGSIYSTIAFEITVNSHTVHHVETNIGIGLVQYGYGYYESYAWPGGQRFAKLGEYCTPQWPATPGDGIDNDCSGSVDEIAYDANKVDTNGNVIGNFDMASAPPPNGGGNSNTCSDSQAFDSTIDWTGNVATITNPSTGKCACIGSVTPM